ncbi:MAG: hypothetical protein U9N85_13555 [Bacteroidota bacterium]|nr:hypothetical protein [Bacteroidota bacterium]
MAIEDMIKCSECEQEINASDLFCPYCNALNEPNEKLYICPVCGMETPESGRKCAYCCSLKPK